MNEKNLIPITKRSKEDARKIRSKGGKAMWEKTRAAKNFRESITLLLSAQLPKDSPYYKEVTALFEKLGISSTPCVRDLVDLGVLKKAANGDVQAAAFLRDSAGEKPKDVVETHEDRPPVMLGVIPVAAKETPAIESH